MLKPVLSRDINNVGYPKEKKNDLLIIRINSKGDFVNSRPCNECIEMMRQYKIGRIYYSDDKGKIVKEKLSEMELLHENKGALKKLIK